MNVSCPECRSVFRVDPAKVTSVAMRARCSVCGGVIAVGAAVQWTDDLPAVTMSTARSTLPPMGSTPAGVRPVMARTAPAAATPAPPRRVDTPVRPAEVRVRPTPWNPPAAFVPSAPRPAPEPPAMPAPERHHEADRPAPAESFVSAPLGEPPAAQSRSVPSGALPFAPGATPARPVPAIPEGPPAAPDGGSSVPAAAVEAGAAPAPRTFGAPLTPPARVAVSAVPPVEPASAPPARAAGPSGVPDASAAFSTRSTPALPPAAVSGQRRPINPFLANDPNQKARRLARALVSDMVAYHPSRREEGLQQGTLKQLFRDEIKKSYEEYVEQVGREFAESTVHFQEALNDVLAGGRKVF